MNRIIGIIRARRRRTADYRSSIHYAIAHAVSEGERNDLIILASEQGVSV